MNQNRAPDRRVVDVHPADATEEDKINVVRSIQRILSEYMFHQHTEK